MVFIHVSSCSSQWLLTLAIPHAVAYSLTLDCSEGERGLHLCCLGGVGQPGKHTCGPRPPRPLYTRDLALSHPVRGSGVLRADQPLWR